MDAPTDAAPTRRLGHQPALDGIRGGAIVLAMLVHVGLLAGGFVGVDLFFVLSGFLITTLLLQERDRTGGVSFREFYRRRVRRLLPPLLVTVVLAWIAAAVYPVALTDKPYWVGAIGAVLYVTNWMQLVDSNTLRTLAHTWSLAVEEQFYLVWPVGLVVLVRRRRDEVRSVLGTVAIVTGLSLVYVIVVKRVDPGANLYVSTFSRAGELLLGCGLSVLWRHRRVPGWLTSAVVLVAALGALAYVIATCAEQTGWLYRDGGLYIAAAAGLVLIAVVVERPAGRLARLLSWKPLTATGRISYGMYLYNYPLSFALSPAVLGLGARTCQVLILGATWALGALSFHYLERPLIGRHRQERVG